MFLKDFKLNWWIVFIIVLAFLIRIAWIDFPKFTSDEARVSYRGYTLATEGRDELGRFLPIIFNSSDDYQLPLTSYMSAASIGIFGKNDFGARIPYIILGTMLVLLTYKIAQFFNPRKDFCLFAASVVAFSPAMIFLSKTPNESIVLSFLLMLLFYHLVKEGLKFVIIIPTILLILISSKFAWFIMPLFVPSLLFFLRSDLDKRMKIKLSLIILSLSILLFFIFLHIPQGKRSLAENEFSLFLDATITNGIDQLRGQGLKSGWPPIIEKALFNKLHYFSVGILNWLSQVQLSAFFGKFDEKNINGFANTGALQKILIIPFMLGLFYMLRSSEKRYNFLLFCIIIFTYPFVFILSSYHLKPVLLTIPILAIIISNGLTNFNKLSQFFIVVILIFELGFLFLNLNANIRITRDERPVWIQDVIRDGLKRSKSQKLAISDNLADNLGPFIQWYMEGKIRGSDESITFPYKVQQTKIGNIKVIGEDNIFYNCGQDTPTNIISSKRDVIKIGNWLNVKTELAIKNTYKNDRGEDIAYFFEPTICVH